MIAKIRCVLRLQGYKNNCRGVEFFEFSWKLFYRLETLHFFSVNSPSFFG